MKNISIALDWLEFFGSGDIPVVNLSAGKDAKTVFTLSDEIVLQYQGHGTAMYNLLYTAYYFGEAFCTIQANPRFCKGNFTEKTIQIKIENHVLYTNYWLNYVEELIYLLNIQIDNVTRLDIAVDGLQNVHEFLNMYQKQSADSKTVHRKGKAAWNAYQMHDKTMLNDRFTIGSSKSDRVVAFYCKSKEIEVSNKNYISKFWSVSSMQIPTDSEVYRLEMRFKSQYLKKLNDFDWLRLTEKEYLASLFKTGAHNFFDFTYGLKKEEKRNNDIKIIPYDDLKAKLLTKNTKPESQDRYKAKLSIHLDSKLLITNKVKRQDVRESIVLRLNFMVNYYNLEDWYNKKLPHWIEIYEPMQLKIEKK